MKLDAEFFKKHPYATGSVVIVGGLVVFYLLSRQQSGGAAVSSGSGSSDAQIASLAAGASVQQAAINAQQQTAQLNAQVANAQTSAEQDVTNKQTLASLVATLFGTQQSTEVAAINANAETLQQANQETVQQNIATLEENGITNQVNAQVEELANNNQTGLQELEDQLSAQGAIATQSISAAYGLATQQQSDYEENVQLLAPNFGKQYNSALDANNAAAETLTVLSGGNPSVATAGVNSSATSVVSGNNASASKVGSVTSGINSLLQGLFA